jgi:hypothetical protein
VLRAVRWNRHGEVFDAFFVLCFASQFQPLFVGTIDKRHMKDRRWVSFDSKQTFSAVWGDGVGAAFVTEDRNSGQYRPEGCGRQWHRSLLGFPAYGPAANAPIPDSLERNMAADAGSDQLLGQPNDAALRRREGTS